MRDEKRGKITHLPLPAGKQENPPCKKNENRKRHKKNQSTKEKPQTRSHARHGGTTINHPRKRLDPFDGEQTETCLKPHENPPKT